VKASPSQKGKAIFVSKIAYLLFCLCTGIGYSGCTQTNSVEPAKNDLAVTSTTPEGPRIDSSRVEYSGVELLYADVDGNGVSDRIERCGTGICVYPRDHEGHEGPVHSYTSGDWKLSSIEQVHNLDEQPGDELIIRAIDATGRIACLCVIRDRGQTLVPFTDPAWQDIIVDSIQETDAHTGKEIIILAKNDQGRFHCLCVLHFSTGTIQSYSSVNWSIVSILAYEDTDGRTGKEIIVEVQDKEGTAVCICIVRDRETAITTYGDARSGTYQLYGVLDTDGYDGAEIVLHVRGADSMAVHVIHDRMKEETVYPFDDVVIESLSNRDNLPGSEICVRTSHGKDHIAIRDRTKDQQPVEACT